jgi:hypothetical protein
MRTTQEHAAMHAPADLFLRAPAQPELLDLPPATYLALDGVGAPEGTAFQDGIRAIYRVAYALKLALRKSGRMAFKPAALEALWTTREGGLPGTWTAPRWEWRWKLLLRVPPNVSKKDVEAAKRAVVEKDDPGPAPRVSLQRLAEHKVVQALHRGPYTTERETLGKMVALMTQRHLHPHGLHHEIYLGDPRRTRPERLRTILRVPVA